jgi:hypothetical protein
MAELPDEITGHWIVDSNGKVTRDDAEKAIEDAINGRLTKIAARNGGWTRLYQDPSDKSYFELSFPQGGMQGAGPLHAGPILVQ